MSELTTSSERLRLVRPRPERGDVAARRPGDGAGKRAHRGQNRRFDAGVVDQMRPSDPRWVLAVRTAEVMEAGGVLPPDRRERLTRVGRMLGLTAFDVSLVIAIVQDQVRRGHSTLNAPGAGVEQLQMIQMKPGVKGSAWSRWWPAAVVAGMVLVAEVVVVWGWFWG